MSDLSCDEVKDLANKAVHEYTGEYLTDTEIKILEGSYDKLKYDEMAEKLLSYGSQTIREQGMNLWKKLSDALREKVSKSNFQTALKRYRDEQSNAPSSPSEQIEELESSDAKSEDLGLPLRLKSRFYIQRDRVESQCYKVLNEDRRTFLRIKGNRRTGKTSLLIRVEEEARELGYKPVYMNLELVLIDEFPTMNDFMRSFCAFIAEELGKEHPLDKKWQEKLGCNGATTKYFEEYLLTDLDARLILILDNFDRVYEKLGSEKGDDFRGEPFGNHLRQLLGELQEHLDLEKVFYRVRTADAPVELGVIEKFKLQGMGLVKEQGDNRWVPRCKLYSHFFLSK